MVTEEGVAATVSDSPKVAFKATLAVLEVSWQTAAGTARVSKASMEISFAGSTFLRLGIAIAPRHRFPVQRVATNPNLLLRVNKAVTQREGHQACAGNRS